MEITSKNASLDEQVQQLAQELKLERSREVPNIEELTEKVAAERLEHARRKWEHERDQMTRDLQNRVDKVVQLEMENGDLKDAYRALESCLTREEQQYKQRSQKQEKSLEHLNLMYQQAISDRSTLKIDLNIAQKQVQKKDDKIIALEKAMVANKEKVRLIEC